MYINLYESSNESSPVNIILENKFRPNVLSAECPVGQNSDLFSSEPSDIFSVSVTACFHLKQIPGLTSLPLSLTAEKSTKMKISADKIFYNFSISRSRYGLEIRQTSKRLY